MVHSIGLLVLVGRSVRVTNRDAEVHVTVHGAGDVPMTSKWTRRDYFFANALHVLVLVPHLI